jgi:hypothetical protein
MIADALEADGGMIFSRLVKMNLLRSIFLEMII